jgi:hypothetical protein
MPPAASAGTGTNAAGASSTAGGSTTAAGTNAAGASSTAGASTTAPATAAAATREVFPPHIEKRANTLFQQIYTGQISIDDAIRLLKDFKDSTKENNDVFACMLHSLFDEFRFFASYPDKELQVSTDSEILALILAALQNTRMHIKLAFTKALLLSNN